MRESWAIAYAWEVWEGLEVSDMRYRLMKLAYLLLTPNTDTCGGNGDALRCRASCFLFCFLLPIQTNL